MLSRRILLSLGLFAAAWSVAAHATEPRETRASSASADCAAAPFAPEALVAVDHSCQELTGAGPAAPADIPQAVLSTETKPPRQIVLIEAQVLEKYRGFRESLSAP